MQNNWPILVAALLMAGAVSYGLLRQGEFQDASKVDQPVRPLPSQYVAEAPNSTSAVATPVAAPTPVDAVPPEADRAELLAAQTIPAAPVLPDNFPAFNSGTDYGTALAGVRNALFQRFNVTPIATATGAVVTLPGVRVDIDSTANWSVKLYNASANGVQNDTFNKVKQVIGGQLGIDFGTPPLVGPDNKSTLKTQSKLGRVSVVTDPALNNSIQISPIQKRAPVNMTAAPVGGAPAVGGVPANKPLTIPAPPLFKPVPPAAPVIPAAPPKAPGADQF